MVAAAGRRVLLDAARARRRPTFASFVFFWQTDLPLKGQPWTHGYRHWARGLLSGDSYRGLFSRTASGRGSRRRSGTRAILLGGACSSSSGVHRYRRLAACGATAPSMSRCAALRTRPGPSAVPARVDRHAARDVVREPRHDRPIGAGGWPGAAPPASDFERRLADPVPGRGVAVQHALDVSAPRAAVPRARRRLRRRARAAVPGLLQTLALPFITTARGKGMSESRIFFRHALRISVSTFVGSLLADFGAIFGAALAVDAVFGLGGLGTLLLRLFPLNSVRPDRRLRHATAAADHRRLILASSLLADRVLAWLDPRLRRE